MLTVDVGCRRRCAASGLSMAWTAAVLLSTHVLYAQGGIVEPTTPVLYLRSGDQLHLTCEQRVTLTSVEKDKVSWWKAASWRGVAVDIPDDRLRYQQIDTGGADAPYTVNQANVSGDLLRSELVKNDVSAVDSGFYRCRLDLGGEFGRILVTVVDMTGEEPVAERVNSRVQLTCRVTDEDGVNGTSYPVSWYKDGHEIGGGGKYELTAGGSVLTVRRVRESDVGQYQCAVTLGTGPSRKTLKHIVNLFSHPYVRSFDRSHSVVAGRSLVLDCRAWGWRTPNVSWYRGQQQLTADTDSRVSLSAAPGRPSGSRLTVDGVEESDRDYYTCVVWSDEWRSQHNATVLVRVKGRLAALWPLLGLGVEVVVLCVIIVAYEMKRNKRLLLDEDDAATAADDSTAKAKMAANSNSSTTPDRSRRRKDTN